MFHFPHEDSKTLSVCPYPEKRNHHSYANVSPTLVIDTSMEMPSQVLQHRKLETQKCNFSFKKVRNCILTCAEELKSP